MLNDKFLDTVFEAFSKVSYNVLMKLDFVPEKVPANIKIQTWMPQQDVLRKYKNIQGGEKKTKQGRYPEL